jgi:molybdopterin biosynthesis enzyme
MASGELEIDEARRVVLGAVTPLEPEPVALEQALGSVLGEDVSAEQSVPAFDNSAMDGFAVRAEDVANADDSRPVMLGVIDGCAAPGWCRRGCAAGGDQSARRARRDPCGGARRSLRPPHRR